MSPEDWIAACTAFLVKEKEFTRLRDQVSQARRDLPWVRVEKEYVFDGPSGREMRAELFQDGSQLVMYHFMFSPAWKDGCPHCSFWADGFNGIPIHLNQRDVTFVAVSRAPLARIQAFRKKMGWSFKWVSSYLGEFNHDFQASFRPEDIKRGQVFYNDETSDMGMAERKGMSVFYQDEDADIYHTYSCYARGIDMVNPAYQILDLVPKGRDEEGLESPQAWVRHHDRYKG